MGGYTDEMFAAVYSVLRPNVPYIMVNFNDDGLNAGKFDHKNWYPNLLVLSAGGHGHVPIPLFREHKVQNNHVPVVKRTIDINYVGESLRNARTKCELACIHSWKDGTVQTSINGSLGVSVQVLLQRRLEEDASRIWTHGVSSHGDIANGTSSCFHIHG
jgi:hypothetical protein